MPQQWGGALRIAKVTPVLVMGKWGQFNNTKPARMTRTRGDIAWPITAAQ